MMPRLSFIERLGALLVVLASGITLALGGERLSLGVLVGGALSVANLYALRALIGALVRAKQPPRQAMLALLLVSKFVVLGAAIFVIVTYLPLNPLGVILGVSLAVLAVLAEGFRLALRGDRAQLEGK